MALEVGIVGLPGAGKTTIFNALTKAGAQIGAYSGPSGKEHVGMAEIADERLQKQAKSGDPMLKKEVTALERLLAHLDEGKNMRDWPNELPPELDPLTTKLLIPLENGPGGIDGQLELELAELSDAEADEFREGKPSALGAVVQRLFEALDLISFFTAGEKETRAWTLRRGQTALEAAGTIHSDIARGFIRCEVIRWDDLVAAGSHSEAARKGLQRLEGKNYAVADGDVLNIRFNV